VPCFQLIFMGHPSCQPSQDCLQLYCLIVYWALQESTSQSADIALHWLQSGFCATSNCTAIFVGSTLVAGTIISLMTCGVCVYRSACPRAKLRHWCPQVLHI
jgi:hypothetical protein